MKRLSPTIPKDEIITSERMQALRAREIRA
jgi:hypothetical protein